MSPEQHTATSKETILAHAREVLEAGQTAEWKDGKCSSCGQAVDQGNFCYLCSATFLTKEQIESGETIN